MTTPTSTSPVSNGKNAYAVVIGDAILDIAGMQPTVELMRPREASPGVIRFKPGGVARSTAENLARLGCDCYLLSAFGDDHYGRELMAATRQSGVDLSHALVVPEMATGMCLILNGRDGEAFYMLYDPAINQRLTPEWLEGQRALLDDAALIVANTAISEQALEWLFTHYSDAPIYIDTVDTAVFHRIRPWLAKVLTLKPNRREASLLTGLPFNSREDAPAVANGFHQVGVRQVVLSLGAHGLYFSDGVQADWIAPLPVEVVNVTGAGDALMAGLAYGYLHGLTCADSAAFGNACAALTLTTLENTYAELSPTRVRALLQHADAIAVSSTIER